MPMEFDGNGWVGGGGGIKRLVSALKVNEKFKSEFHVAADDGLSNYPTKFI